MREVQRVESQQCDHLRCLKPHWIPFQEYLYQFLGGDPRISFKRSLFRYVLFYHGSTLNPLPSCPDEKMRK
jgi:hypothetical protein